MSDNEPLILYGPHIIFTCIIIRAVLIGYLDHMIGDCENE
jgi:hypothetical protein